MKHWMLTAALICFGSIANASSPWAGRLDLTSPAALGAWQSLTSIDQAIGISKRFFHIDYAGQPMLNLSVFGGVSKPITDPGLPARFLAGDVVQVPGSALDWALGTKWGDAWLPPLKTGVLFAHDLSRIAKAHLKPDFIGIGASWPFGS